MAWEREWGGWWALSDAADAEAWVRDSGRLLKPTRQKGRPS